MKKILISFFLIYNFFFSFGNDNEFSFSIIGNRLIINIDTLNFIFDTGASGSLLDSTLARKLELPFKNELQIITPAGAATVISTEFVMPQFKYAKRWDIMSFRGVSQSLGINIHGIIGAEDAVIENIIDIDFKNETLFINAYPPSPIHSYLHEYKLIPNNNSLNETLGRFFSISPAIRLPLTFNNNDTSMINLVIDTGCQYKFAFISNDSTLINSYTDTGIDYTGLGGFTTRVSYGKVSFNWEDQEISSNSPFFYSPGLTTPIKNDFYGLLGIPFLEQFERVVINWQERKLTILPK
jgi:hypothetical protein